MNLNISADDMKTIFCHYGENNQLLKLIEECGELSAAASRYRAQLERFDSADENTLIHLEHYKRRFNEELADVLIMVLQFISASKENRKAILAEAGEKIERQFERIDDEILEQEANEAADDDDEFEDDYEDEESEEEFECARPDEVSRRVEIAEAYEYWSEHRNEIDLRFDKNNRPIFIVKRH